VKITVIATGFQQESAERRDQVLTSVLRQAAGPRIESRPATPRFASEEEDAAEFVAPTPRTVQHPQVLVPVSTREMVSAFRGPEEENLQEMEASDEQEPMGVGIAVAEESREPEMQAPAQPDYEEDTQDNLDIPAFLRKGGL
jgi:cell division protein FtsZ